MWEPKTRHQIRGVPMSHFQEWQFAFVEEWLRLSEGCSDLPQRVRGKKKLAPAQGLPVP